MLVMLGAMPQICLDEESFELEPNSVGWSMASV